MRTTASGNRRKGSRKRARWMNDQFICGKCGSKKFTVFRERVARKVHTRTSRRRRIVGICARGHKTRIGFPSAT